MSAPITLPRSGVVLTPVTDSPACREFQGADWFCGIRRFEAAPGVEWWWGGGCGGAYAGTEARAIELLDARILTLRAALMPADARDEITTLRTVVAELLHTTRLDEPCAGWLEARKRAVLALNREPLGPRTVSLAETCADVAWTSQAVLAALGVTRE